MAYDGLYVLCYYGVRSVDEDENEWLERCSTYIP